MNIKTLFLLGAASTPTMARAQTVAPDGATTEHVVTVRGDSVRTTTASTTVLTAKEIAAVPKRTAEDALRLVPGLTLAQHGSEGKGHQFFLRGFDAMHGSDLEVNVDGIPVNEWSNVHAQGYVDLGFVIPETITAVEVTKGPFALEQGAFAMAGTANYRLGVPEELRGTRVAYTVGTTNRHRAVFVHSPVATEGREFLAAEAIHDDGFGQNRAIERGAVFAKAELFRSEHLGTVSVLGSGYFADFELPGSMRNDDVESGRKGFYDSYDHASDGQSGKTLIALNQRWRSVSSTFESTLYVGRRRLALLENYTGFSSDLIRGDRRSQLQNTWDLGGSAGYRHELTAAFDVNARVGVRSAHLAQEQRHVGRELQPITLVRSLVGWQHLLHAGVGLGWTPSTDIHGELGLRADVAKVSGRDRVEDINFESSPLAAISPRAHLEWRTNATIRVIVAYGRGFRPPEARAFTPYAPAVTSLGSELYAGTTPEMTVADSMELGLRWETGRYWGGSIAGFGTVVARESIFDHVSGTNLELNGTRRLGGELSFHSNPVDWLLLLADVTAVDARFSKSGNPIPFAPWLVGGVRMLFTQADLFRGGLRFMALAPRPLPHGAIGTPLASLDLTAGTTWGPLSFDVEVENVLNLRQREGEYHYASNWNTTAEPSALPVIHYVAGPPRNVRVSVGANW